MRGTANARITLSNALIRTGAGDFRAGIILTCQVRTTAAARGSHAGHCLHGAPAILHDHERMVGFDIWIGHAGGISGRREAIIFLCRRSASRRGIAHARAGIGTILPERIVIGSSRAIGCARRKHRGERRIAR